MPTVLVWWQDKLTYRSNGSIFNITNERGETAIIGDEITGYDLTLNIQWESTLEFGNVSHIYFILGVIGETEGEIDDYHLSPDSLSNSKVYTDLASKIPLMKNGYVRIHATTDKGHSVYTNPIWISSPTSIISNVSITGITADSTIITWDTNGLSSSLVKYGTESGNYTLQKYDLVNVTSHSIHLFGLLPDTTYYFVVNSTDQHRNSNQSNEYEFTTEILRIPLQAGWDLISLPLIPEDTSVDMVLSPIKGNYSIIWAYNASDITDHWKKYDPSAPFGNDMAHMESGIGYWIMMTSDNALNISGTVPQSTDINLKAGWNLIGYNSLDSQPIADAFSSIAGNYSIVWAYDASDTEDHWKKYDPVAPFGNDLANMEAGKGYWIMMTTDDILEIE